MSQLSTTLAGLPLVSLVVFLPLVGAVLLAFLPSSRPQLIRYAALGIALATWVVSLAMLVGYNPNAAEHYQYTQSVPWIPIFGIGAQ